MRIEQLHAHAFRNLRQITIAPGAKTVVLQGDNGQGKTNILEALYVCATGRSFRHAHNLHLVQHGAQAAVVRAIFYRADVRHEVAVAIDAQQRRLRIDGRATGHSLRLLDLVNVVAFFPDDLAVVKGPPEVRRRFFDRAVANAQPGFAQAVVAYQRALRHRNSLLRQKSAPDRGMLAVYEKQMVELAETMHTARVAALAELWPVARSHFAALLSNRQLNLVLHSGVTAADAGGVFAEAFGAALKRDYARDRARGYTGQGPHRADLLCLMDGRDARLYASQGQQRSLILALKLAEVVCLRQKRGFAPILLMDDVCSELDAKRAAFLFDVVQTHAGQTWITTTGQLPLPNAMAAAGGVQTLHVQNGAIA